MIQLSLITPHPSKQITYLKKSRGGADDTYQERDKERKKEKKEGKRKGKGKERQREFLGAVNEREEYERSTTGLWSAGTGVEIEVDGGKARGRRRLPVMTRETCERHGCTRGKREKFLRKEVVRGKWVADSD